MGWVVFIFAILFALAILGSRRKRPLVVEFGEEQKNPGGPVPMKITLKADRFRPVKAVRATDNEGNPTGDPLTDAVFESANNDICTVKTNEQGVVEFHAGPSKGVGTLGTTTVTVTSASAPNLQGVIEVEVIAGDAAAIGVEFDDEQTE